MNKRIYELINQANTEYSEIVGEHNIYYYSRFAEILSILIIEECADVAETAEPYQTKDLILTHFGVKP